MNIVIIVANALSECVQGIWDRIVIAVKGKKLAVLGVRAVGKTTLIQFLTEGSIPPKYKQNVAPEQYRGNAFQLKDLQLSIKGGLDFGGTPDNYGQWKKECQEADLILYLLRADQLLVGDETVEGRILDDLKHIEGWLAEWRKKQKRPLPFFIIGTHCDKDIDFRVLTDDTVGAFHDKFRDLPIMRELVARGGGLQRVKVVLGSMESIEATQNLVYEIFKQASYE
jgi:hypothetical protein